MLDPYGTSDSTTATLDAPAQMIEGIFEPPRGFVLSSIARHKLVVLIAAVLLAVAGAAVGKARKSTYTASATLQVGQVNPNSPGFYSYVQSSASLATAFSRAIAAEPVLATIQDKLKLAPSQAIARLSAEPIPQAPAFRVIATGPTRYAAVQLTNVAANAVIAYEGQSNSANPEAESLLDEYRKASIRLQHAVASVARLSRGSHRKSTPKPALVQAEADKDADATRFRAIGAAYDAAIASQAPRSGLVSLLAGASTATGSRRSQIELFGFIGLLVGVVVGCVAAIAVEWRRSGRGLWIEMPRSESA
jgi:uncharacterized protein involved in exopolysaccharide biosynthesis